MKLRKIIAIAGIAFLFNNAFGATSSSELKNDLSSALTDMSNSMLEEFETILPQSNSLLSVQPDAYIGKLLPSIPPHFAVGLNFSVTPVTVDFISDNIDKVTDVIKGIDGFDGNLAFDLPISGKLPYPAAAINARVGGLFLPFDVGVNAVTTGSIFNDKSFGDKLSLDFNYTSAGFDLRYAVLEGNGLLPKISLGGGYQFVRQQIGFGFSNSFEADIDAEHSADVYTSADVNLKIDTHTVFAQIQVSKTLLIFTPYIGLKAMFTTANCAYDWNYNTKLNGNPFPQLSDRASDSYKDTVADIGIQTQVFGGLSLNLAVFQTSFNAAYNFSSKLFTGAIGLAIKL
ncbi:MAG: hypothetical protein J6X84_03615 [Treponema sp.]|nr:hypothetical protein [Treponema sp.]